MRDEEAESKDRGGIRESSSNRGRGFRVWGDEAEEGERDSGSGGV